MLKEIQDYFKCLNQVEYCTECLASPHRRIHSGPKIFLVKSCVLLQTTSFLLKYTSRYVSEEHLPNGHELAMRPEMSIMNWVFSGYQTQSMVSYIGRWLRLLKYILLIHCLLSLNLYIHLYGESIMTHD